MKKLLLAILSLSATSAFARTPLADAPDYFLDFTCSSHAQLEDAPQVNLVSTGDDGPQERYVQVTGNRGVSLIPLKLQSVGTGVTVYVAASGSASVKVEQPERDSSVALVNISGVVYNCNADSN